MCERFLNLHLSGRGIQFSFPSFTQSRGDNPAECIQRWCSRTFFTTSPMKNCCSLYKAVLRFTMMRCPLGMRVEYLSSIHGAAGVLLQFHICGLGRATLCPEVGCMHWGKCCTCAKRYLFEYPGQDSRPRTVRFAWKSAPPCGWLPHLYTEACISR